MGAYFYRYPREEVCQPGGKKQDCGHVQVRSKLGVGVGYLACLLAEQKELTLVAGERAVLQL